ncbi:hypothetical protein [Paenibacillus sp. FSL P2-0136]|uniref:hypothetical protein n=1 Tax=Paenibacillus sp. FSL P2-0136 TaxID=2975317 RepID=UPI0030DAF408
MNITSSLSHDLALAAQHYFQRELRINFSTLKTEMDYIDRMHRRIEKLEFLWNNIMDMYLGNSRPIITMQSYFIHKTPQVTFDVISKKKSIEFGDLLYVYNENQSNGYQKQNALLLQAKMRDNHQLDPDQLYLYSCWPDFSFTNSSMVNRKFTIDTQPNSHLGARYLYLEKTVSSFVPFRWAKTARPRPKLCEHNCDFHYLWELLGLMDFSRGKELDGDWGQAINEVVNWVKYNNVPYTNRTQGNRAAAMLSMLATNSSNGKNINVQSFESKEAKKGFWLVVVNADNIITNG